MRQDRKRPCYGVGLALNLRFDERVAVLSYGVKTVLLSFLVALSFGGSLAAHNNLFLPGDAFFSAAFSKDFFKGNSAKGDLAFEYHRYAGEFMACGWAGYEKLEVKAVPEPVLHNLRKAHGILFGEFARSAVADGDGGAFFPIFVYNRDFPLSSPFGLKYNERWAEVQTGEAKMGHAIYDDLGGLDFIIDDWASATEIAPLAIAEGRAPMVSAAGETGIVSKPVEMAAGKAMFVVLAGGDVKKFAQREEGLVFFVVTEDLRRYRFNREGVAMPQIVDAPSDDTAAKRESIAKDQTALRAALSVYRLNFGQLPTKAQGLTALVKKPESGAPDDWMPVLKRLPSDPWRRPYRWDGDVIFSLGADGVESKDDVVEPFTLGEEEAATQPVR